MQRSRCLPLLLLPLGILSAAAVQGDTGTFRRAGGSGYETTFTESGAQVDRCPTLSVFEYAPDEAEGNPIPDPICDINSNGRYAANSMCGCNCRCRDKLFGWFPPSDNCFSSYISPMTNPVFFEDPRTLTEARLIYLHHKVPTAAGGGDVNLFAMQIRAALTERLSVIATKDGYLTSTNPLIDDGWADISLGLKYNLFADCKCQRLVSAGLTYELAVGSSRALQGNGDGLFNLFLSAATPIGRCHWISGTGFLLPTDTSAESQIWFWSNHIDRRLGCSKFYFLAEANWYHWMRSGRAGLPGVEGGDLFNFGSTGVAGNNIVTGAVGVKYKPHQGMEIGVAWEAPLTDRRDVLDNRLTFDWILRY